MMNIIGNLEITEMGKLQWYAVGVRSRHEFSVTERLVKSGIDAFLPIVERIRKWKDRNKVVEFSLFPGYLFVHIPQNNISRLSVLKTPGVVRFIGPTLGEPEPVPAEQINSLKKLLESKEALDPYPYLKDGNRVRINKGPLSGVEGILVGRKGIHNLVLSVDILQQGVSVQVEASIVETLQ
jgi:transcription termination/antitermination protein NusG